jgi:hypothetical protein
MTFEEEGVEANGFAAFAYFTIPPHSINTLIIIVDGTWLIVHTTLIRVAEQSTLSHQQYSPQHRQDLPFHVARGQWCHLIVYHRQE